MGAFGFQNSILPVLCHTEHMLRWWCFLLLTFTGFAQTAPVPQKTPPKAEPKISAAEAKQLFASVDDIMKFASLDSGLAVRKEVKRQLVDRDQVEQLLTERLKDDKDAQRFEHGELVMKKFGMLPLDFQLRPFLLKVLREQVAGFYDVKEKTINLLDWLPADAQQPVLAHELTHALQDQAIDLDKWQDEPEANDTADEFNKGIRSEEESFARSAVTEGQAMVVLLDYLLRDTGTTVQSSPGMVFNIRANPIEKDTALAQSPLILRESMLFPYREGAEFVAAVLAAKGKSVAFDGLLHHPPRDSHEILAPSSYLEGDAPADLTLPELGTEVTKHYPKFDTGAVGQFDTRVFLQQFRVEAPWQVASAWQGGVYYAGQRSATTPRDADDLALLYVSYWKDEESAGKFKGLYASLLPQRYPGLQPSGSGWTSAAGFDKVVQVGNTVIACEGFDEKTTDTLIAAVSHPQKKPQVAVDHGELGFRLGGRVAAMLRGAGIH